MTLPDEVLETSTESFIGELTAKQCQQARLSRDARFDGRFFVAVKTTGIFCRPICPANLPKESNIEYFPFAAKALEAGFRPCLRCRPESAPNSWAWHGAATTFYRAMQMIDSGVLQSSSLTELAERLGITDRYLRKLFDTHLGMPPKRYAQYQQLMFAKQLLHNSRLSIADIGLACGFNSVRRFNDACLKLLKLRPSELRKGAASGQKNEVKLLTQQPVNWPYFLQFYARRAINGVEEVTNTTYKRSFRLGGSHGWFCLTQDKPCSLSMTFSVNNISGLKALVKNVRRMFDLDANIQHIQQQLMQTPLRHYVEAEEYGIRIPGAWNTWEAGIRAILGQQVSVAAAMSKLNELVTLSAPEQLTDGSALYLFPEPKQILQTDMQNFALITKRKQTLTEFARLVNTKPGASMEDCLAVKGIGPWTLEYMKLRGLSDPDCFMDKDLVVKKALSQLDQFDYHQLSPWGSYATLYCWNAQ